MQDDRDRRMFLRGAGVLAAGFAVPGLLLDVKTSAPQKEEKENKEGEEEEVTPTEDLMREHGLLNRVLLIYEDCGRKLSGNTSFDPQALAGAAGVIRHFIEEYHEKLEEQYLFPRFEKANKLTDLVKTLREQHAAGRNVTATIERLATAGTLKNAAERQKLVSALHAFIRMYRPHEAREDTVLFPALHEIISRNEFDALGEDFEKREHELFGKEGFEGQVAKVAEIEKSLGIYDLAQFTPR